MWCLFSRKFHARCQYFNGCNSLRAEHSLRKINEKQQQNKMSTDISARVTLDDSSDDENGPQEIKLDFWRVGQAQRFGEKVICEEVRLIMPADFYVAGKLFTRVDSPSNHLAVALHGWLDNANSLGPLAVELLNRLPAMFKYILCVDAPGCGQSEHRQMTYQTLEGVYDILQIVKVAQRNLGKSSDKITCIGHSYGGATMMTFAALAPEKVERLIILDIFGYLTVSPDQGINVMKRNIAKRIQIDSRRNLPRKVYPSKERLIEKLQSRFKWGITREAALELIARGARYIEDLDGWQFTYDPYHIASWFFYLGEDQLQTYLKEIKCPLLLLWTTKQLLYNFEERKEVMRKSSVNFKEIYVSSMKNRHHFHLENPSLAAELITENLLKDQMFLNSRL